MTRKHTLQALLALAAIAGGATADTTVIVQDGFGDGDRDNDLILDGAATNPSDVGVPWYLVRGDSDVVPSVADDAGGIGMGSALDVLTMTTSSRAFAASFDPVTLEQDGDRLRVRVFVRATEMPVDPTDGGLFPTANGDRRFRFGLYSSNGTPWLPEDTGDSTLTDDDTGFLAQIDVGVADGNSMSLFGDKADGILGGSSVSTGTSAADSSYFLGNSTRILEMILTRSGDNILTAITFNGELADDGVADFVEDIQAFNLPYTFDYVAFGTSGASIDYRIDQVLVDFTRPDSDLPQTDGFEDGDYDNNGVADAAINDPGDIGFTWFESRGTSSFDVTLEDDSAGIGTGNALAPFSITTSTRAMSAAITPVELVNDGDFVKMAFDFRAVGFIPSSDRRFRFGIHSDGGTPVTSNGSSETGDDVGYMVQFDTGASAASTATIRGDLPNGLLSGSTRSTGGTTELPEFALDDNDTHRIELEVRRRFDGDLGRDVNDLRLIFDGVEATMGVDDGDEAGDDNPMSFLFNQVSIGTNSLAFLDYRIDNVEIETNAGVEPTFATEDGFEDGDRQNDGVLEGAENDAGDVGFAWFQSRGNSSYETDIVDDSAGIGTGNVLSQFSITTSTRAVSAAIEPISLNTGDSVTMEFDLRLRGSIPASDRRVRFGIHHDGGTPVTSDGSSQTDDDTGYMVQFDTGASAASTATIRGDLPNGLLGGSTRSTGATTEDAAYALDDNDTHRIALRVERAFDSDLGRDVNLLTLTFDGVVATDGADEGDGAGDDNPLTYDFNQISIGTSGVAFVDMVVDNIVITSDAVNPCPADLAAPFGVLDLSDITAFVSAFTAQNSLADLAEPFGTFDLNDISTFITSFLAGCP